MKLTLLCNAGLALEAENAMLLVDLPNQAFPPFYALPDDLWERILDREPPYDRVCGFWFTHDHPDHCDLDKVRAYQQRWPEIPVFLPEEKMVRGTVNIGPFRMEYRRMPHAPIPDPPPHVVTWVTAGERSVYLAADAVLDADAHRAFLKGRKADGAVWNSMYLSRPETRALLRETADRNFICHMPAQRPDSEGLWRKLEMNFKRFGPELETVTVWDAYPSETEI